MVFQHECTHIQITHLIVSQVQNLQALHFKPHQEKYFQAWYLNEGFS